MVKNRYNALLEEEKTANYGVKTGGELNRKTSNSPYISQTDGFSSSYVAGGTGNWGSSKPENIIPDLGDSKKNDYVYTGPNYMDQLRSAYNSIYDSNISAANSAYARLKEEAERQALIKKGQARTRQITMEKYVPETLRAMGLKNNGLAADALIGIDNNYTNYLMQALAQEENMKAEASRFLADQTRAANNQKALWDIELLGKQQDAWTMMQQMALSGDYDETALQNFGYSWGFDENQVGSTLDIYKNVLEKEEAEKAASAKLLENQEIETLLTNALGYNYSRDALITIAKQKGISEEGIKNMLSEYDLIYADYNNTTEITEENERIAVDMQAYGVTNNSKAVNPKVMTSAAMYDYLDVAEGKAQGDYIDRIFEVSKNWDNSMNGTFVNFNYGLNFGGLRNVFVFYNGKWYKTNLDAAGIQARSADGKFYANNFDFYKKFGK